MSEPRRWTLHRFKDDTGWDAWEQCFNTPCGYQKRFEVEHVEVVEATAYDALVAEAVKEKEAWQAWARKIIAERDTLKAKLKEAENTLKKIVAKGDDYLHGVVCGDCYETECDGDCPVLYAHQYFGTRRVEISPLSEDEKDQAERPVSWYVKYKTALSILEQLETEINDHGPKCDGYCANVRSYFQDAHDLMDADKK